MSTHIRRNTRYPFWNPRRFILKLRRKACSPLQAEERCIRVTLKVPTSLFADQTIDITHEVQP